MAVRVALLAGRGGDDPTGCLDRQPGFRRCLGRLAEVTASPFRGMPDRSCRCHEVDSARFFPWGEGAATHFKADLDTKRLRVTRVRRRTSTSVLLAALVIGVSIAAVVWGIEEAIQGRERAHGRTELRAALAGRAPLADSPRDELGAAASALAGSQTMQNAFVTHRAASPSFDHRRPTRRRFRALGRCDPRQARRPGRRRDRRRLRRGALPGRVVVSASPTDRPARRGAPAASERRAVVGRRNRASRDRTADSSTRSVARARPSARTRRCNSPATETNVARVYAFRSTPHVLARMALAATRRSGRRRLSLGVLQARRGPAAHRAAAEHRSRRCRAGRRDARCDAQPRRAAAGDLAGGDRGDRRVGRVDLERRAGARFARRRCATRRRPAGVPAARRRRPRGRARRSIHPRRGSQPMRAMPPRGSQRRR